MKNKYILIFILILTTSSLFSQPLTLVENFGRNPGMLKVFIHVPKKLDRTKKPAMVLVLHGCTQTAKSIGAATGWNKLADFFGLTE